MGIAGRAVHVNDVASVGSTLVAALCSAGRDAHLVVEDPRTAGLADRLGSFSIPIRTRILLQQRQKVVRLDPGIVHVHNARHSGLYTVRGVPLVIHCHGTDVRDIEPTSLVGRYLRHQVGRAAHVFYSTWDLRSSVDALGGGEFLPNPVDTSEFHPYASLERERDVLIGVQLSEGKGVTQIMELLREIVRRRPETTFSVLDPAGRENDLAFLGDRLLTIGRVERARLPALMAAHRIAVGQFRSGSAGMYELECMASGTPVAMDLRERGGFAQPPPLPSFGSRPVAESAAWASGLLADPARCQAAGADVRRWVENVHGSEIVAKRVIEVYEEIACRASPGRPGNDPLGPLP